MIIKIASKNIYKKYLKDNSFRVRSSLYYVKDDNLERGDKNELIYPIHIDFENRIKNESILQDIKSEYGRVDIRKCPSEKEIYANIWIPNYLLFCCSQLSPEEDRSKFIKIMGNKFKYDDPIGHEIDIDLFAEGACQELLHQFPSLVNKEFSKCSANMHISSKHVDLKKKLNLKQWSGSVKSFGIFSLNPNRKISLEKEKFHVSKEFYIGIECVYGNVQYYDKYIPINRDNPELKYRLIPFFKENAYRDQKEFRFSFSFFIFTYDDVNIPPVNPEKSSTFAHGVYSNVCFDDDVINQLSIQRENITLLELNKEYADFCIYPNYS